MRSLSTATKGSPHSVQLEKAHAQQQRPSATKNKDSQLLMLGAQAGSLGGELKILHVTQCGQNK